MKPSSTQNPIPLLESKVVFITILILVLSASSWLATWRIFHVDEIQTMHMAWLLNQQDTALYFNSAEVYLIPLALLCRIVQDPIAFMVACRFIFLALLAASCIILSKAVAQNSRYRYHTALILLGGTPILWDFGFEVRHDNVVILGLCFLILILFSQPRKRSCKPLFLGGMVGGLLFLSSFKSIFLWVPILGYTALLFAIRDRIAILRIVAAAAGGMVTVFVFSLASHLLIGSLPLYLKTVRAFFGTVMSDPERFFYWWYIHRFIGFHSWTVALGLLFITTYALKVGKGLFSGEAFRLDDPQAKRMMLLLLGPLFLAINPNPFPYNYLYIVVLAFPAMFYLTDKALTGTTVKRIIVVPALLLLHFAPGIFHTSRHFKFDNRNQRKIVTFANRFTEPKHSVFDGAGLAMYRSGPGEIWYLHSQHSARYMSGDFPSVRDMLALSNSPLLIQSYKWRYMHPDDMEFIRSRYVPFHGTIWILGSSIIRDSPGKALFKINRDGWYTIGTRARESLPGLKLDGTSASSQPVFIHRGSHELEISDPSARVYILWTKGEQKTGPPIPKVGQPVFSMWY